MQFTVQFMTLMAFLVKNHKQKMTGKLLRVKKIMKAKVWIAALIMMYHFHISGYFPPPQCESSPVLLIFTQSCANSCYYRLLLWMSLCFFMNEIVKERRTCKISTLPPAQCQCCQSLSIRSNFYLQIHHKP